MADNAYYTEPGSGRVVAFRDDGAAIHQRCDVEGKLAHDAPAASILPMLVGFFASDSAPSDVSANNDATRAWCLRNGSLVTNLASSGTLITNTGSSLNTNITNASIAAAQSGTWTVQPGNTPNTSPWLTVLNDKTATTGSITAVDSATSSSANAANQTQITGAPTANSSVSCALQGNGTVLIQCDGTASTTCAFERSLDGGTTYTPFAVELVGIGGSVTSQSMTDNKAYFFRGNTAGFTHVRVRCTTYTSGTVNVRLQPGTGNSQIPVNQSLPNVVANAWPIKLTDGTNTAPSLDVAARRGYVQITDGTNSPDISTAGGDGVSNTANRINVISCVVGFNGTTWDRLRSDTTNGLDVDVTRVKPDGTNTMPSLDAVGRAGFIKVTDGTNTMPTLDVVTRAGFFKETDGTLTGGIVDETGASAVDARAVGGGTPHDSVNSGNPLYLGAEAIAHGTNPTAVAAADRTKLYANRAGIPFVIGGHPNVQTIKHTTITTAVTDTAIISVNAGTKIVVTAFTITLDNASTVFPTVLLGFGATTTPTTNGVIGAHGGVPAGGGFSRGDGSGIIGVGGDGEDLRITTTGNATGNGLQICVTYYTIES